MLVVVVVVVLVIVVVVIVGVVVVVVVVVLKLCVGKNKLMKVEEYQYTSYTLQHTCRLS